MVFVDFHKGFYPVRFAEFTGCYLYGEAHLAAARLNLSEFFYAEEAPFLARL
jgi:hypothetical protein